MAKSQVQKKSQKEHCVAIVGAGFAGFNAGGRLPAAGPPFLAHAKEAALFARAAPCGLVRSSSASRSP
jgi:NADH dehydrogenase FAD-containing subunit